MPRVLLVEDDEVIRPLITEAISLLQLDVIPCANADDALKILEATSVGLVVTDVRMPGSMDGLALTQIICSRWRELPLIVISGDAILPPGLSLSNAAFLSKPFSLDTLHDTIKQLLPLP
ncbi:response regulator [Pseudomonas sp. FP198]|uniref:response regulator n=1 Tax=Pseudomonas sp. FP198 TaxID=2954084 RepID=UPI002736620C|nr:response regulator [Pseudomonas sp. FP198]WLG93847.1 response regulator [Pseudomonas sp. FP198]